MVTPFLWFDNQAEEASRFYVSIFKNSKINSIMRGPNGKVSGTSINIDGREFMTLNGGPLFKFTEAISLYVNCETQREIDQLWRKLLSGGGEESRCGWLKDKYGLSWQVVPSILPKLLNDPDPKKAKRVFNAMMKMAKLDIATLKKAAESTK